MTPAGIRAQIETDLAAEERSARMQSIFRQRAEAKCPPATPLAIPPFQTGVYGLKETPDETGEASDGFDWWHAAQGDYYAVCENQTGRVIPDDVFAKLRDRRAKQDAQTKEIALALDSTGRFSDSPYWRGDNDPNRCTVIGVFSGTVLPMPPVKRSSVLPSIAAQHRAKMLRDVEHFMGCHPTNSRMYTITSGKRVPIHRITLREDLMGFHRWLSKMASEPVFKLCGLKMQWRATESGTPKWDAETGKLTLHLHAHCLVTEPIGMTAKRRAKVRRKLWKLFKVHWDDAGTIENAREFVKYPVKPGDLETIARQGGPGVLADFVEAIHGLHTVQPMGDLREVRAIRKQNARRITAFSRPDGRTLEETGDWNAGKRPFTKMAKWKKRAIKQRKCRELGYRLTEITRLKRAISPGVKSHDEEMADLIARDDEGNRRELGVSGRKSPRIANRVIALLAPAPYGTPVCEPGVTVCGFNGDRGAVLRQPRIAAVIEAHRAAWDRAQDVRALLRACAQHAGAHAPAASEGSQRSNNCPGGQASLALSDAETRPPDPVWSRNPVEIPIFDA